MPVRGHHRDAVERAGRGPLDRHQVRVPALKPLEVWEPGFGAAEEVDAAVVEEAEDAVGRDGTEVFAVLHDEGSLFGERG